MKLIGISGLARSGKDSIYLKCKPVLRSMGYSVKRVAFADCLKSECDELLSKYTGISAFTEDTKEKEIIRPLLVTYGTHIRRKLNKNCWIDKIDEMVKSFIKDNIVTFVTDVRFENEINWVHDLGGLSVHISREGVKPPNQEEAENNPKLKNLSSLKLRWGDFNKENPENINSIINQVIEGIRNGR